MSLFPETLVQQVRAAVDGDAVLRLIDYRTETIQDTAETLKCFCPIHHETIFRTLVIDRKAGTYHCSNFSCDGNAGGDLVDLYARAKGISYEQGLLALAGELGLEVDLSVVETYLATTVEVARNYLQLGAFAEAEEHLSALVAIRPDCVAALRLMVELYERRGQPAPLQDTRLQLARALTDQGDIGGALGTLGICQQADPADLAASQQMVETLLKAGRKDAATEAMLKLAEAQAAQGEVNRAIETYRRAQGMKAAGIDAWSPMIQLLLKAGRRDEAVAECLALSDVYLKEGDSESAFNAIESAVELAPEREELYVRQAKVVAIARLTGEPLEIACGHCRRLLAAGSLDLVERVLAELEFSFKDDARVTCLHADLVEAQGKATAALDLRLGCIDKLEKEREFEAALGVLEKTLAERKGNIALLSRKANLLRAMGRTGPAIEVYLEIVELFRGIDELENAAGIYQTVIDLQPDVLEHRRRQIELFLRLNIAPALIEKTRELAELLIRDKKAPEAAQVIERSLAAAPESTELLEMIGGLYETLGRRGEAAEQFVAAARAYERREELPKAEAACGRALKSVPEHLEARELMAGVLMGAGRKLQAIGILADLAGFYLREKDHDSAVRLCERILEGQPDHQAALATLAEAHQRAGREEDFLSARVRIVDAYLRVRDFARASELCEEILSVRDDFPPALERMIAIAESTRKDSDSVSHLWQLAQAQRRVGRHKEEVEALERIFKADPTHEGAWRRQIELHMARSTSRALQGVFVLFCQVFEEAGRSQDAVRLLEEMSQTIESPKPEMFGALARLYQSRNDETGRRHALRLQAELLGRLMRDAEALDAWDQLAKLEPGDHSILRMRIELMKRNDMTVEIVDEYRRLGRALASAGQEQQAQIALTEVIGMRPHDVVAREELIDLLIRRKENVAARKQIEEAAAMLLEDGDPRRAGTLYERIFEFDPGDTVTYHRLIAVHQRVEDIAGAVGVFERLLDSLEKRKAWPEFEHAALEALQLDPSNQRLRRRLADYYVHEGRAHEAETLLLTLAVQQIEAGEFDAASAALEQLLKINPASVPGRAHRAELMVRQGKTEDALNEFMSLTGQLATQEGLQSLIQPQGYSASRGMYAPQYEGVPLIKEYTFGTFVIGERNNFAHASAMAVCRAPGKNYNPLFLYSDVGLGKTHLCHAIAHYVRDHYPQLKVRYITMEEFITGLIDAIGNNTIAAFRNWHKVIDVLIMDDVQFLSGKERAQEEFFHIFNTLFQAGKQVVLTSDRPPKDIAHLEKRLKSRFGAGIIVDIQSPDLETRVAILRQELNGRSNKVQLSNDVLLYIAEHVETNIRELKGALNQLMVRAEISGQNLDLTAARKALEQILAPAV